MTIVAQVLLDMKYDSSSLLTIKMVKKYVITMVMEGENKIVKNTQFKQKAEKKKRKYKEKVIQIEKNSNMVNLNPNISIIILNVNK